MNEHFQLDVQLTLLGPILTRGGQMSEPGIDASLARDSRGRFMLPFSLIKGKVVDALRDLYPDQFEQDRKSRRYGPSSSRFVDWFGQEPRDGAFDPERGRLRFSDFHTNQTGTAADGVIERIQIDAETGSAAGRMLAMLEAPFGYGEEVLFEGHVDFIATQREAESIQQAIESAMRWTPAFGAMRTVGFGRTRSVSTKLRRALRQSSGRPAFASSAPSSGAAQSPSTGPSPSPPSSPPPAVLGFCLSLDRPLCVVGRKHSHNHFESLETIGGAVLKGAVARLLLETTGAAAAGRRFVEPGLAGFEALSKNFAALRFTEARPVEHGAGRRPVEPPLSIVVASQRQGEFFDVALCDKPCLIDDEAPAFQPDWKPEHFALVRGKFGWPEVPRERRTRTAIEPPTGRAADERLFSYGLVLPESVLSDGSMKKLQWLAAIGLDDVAIEERPRVADELSRLLAFGLPHIGKTRATAFIEWQSGPVPPGVDRASLPADAGLHVVTLQTEMLMTDPELLRGDSVAGLRAAYEQFWHEASDGALSLVRYFFARQSLYGGFQAARAKRAVYEPYLLTDRGSVFVVRVNDPQKADAQLTRWRSAGLPTPRWVAERFQTADMPLWRCCPYLPHVGYGEVAIDLACHSQLTVTSSRPENES